MRKIHQWEDFKGGVNEAPDEVHAPPSEASAKRRGRGAYVTDLYTRGRRPIYK